MEASTASMEASVTSTFAFMEVVEASMEVVEVSTEAAEMVEASQKNQWKLPWKVILEDSTSSMVTSITSRSAASRRASIVVL